MCLNFPSPTFRVPKSLKKNGRKKNLLQSLLTYGLGSPHLLVPLLRFFTAYNTNSLLQIFKGSVKVPFTVLPQVVEHSTKKKKKGNIICTNNYMYYEKVYRDMYVCVCVCYKVVNSFAIAIAEGIVCEDTLVMRELNLNQF